ncbi:ric8 guanine nucleotide exchange factor A isoform X2 [Megalopta genalis]|uniref:ric8 guanine nucleotide exchange factor A isoform X2 n=1 Tax=Megalopta genalis TaxID=115081 RepID=UPI001443526A|nr:synembryn-A isoform X2 [Megalopta genalis]
MNALAQKIISDATEEFSKDIVIFQEDYGTKITFDELNEDQLREKLWETLFNYLSDNSQSSIHQHCLSALRILSRDKTNLNELVTDDRLNLILGKAALKDASVEEQTTFTDVTIEALKLLCNLIFNSTNVQQASPTTSCLSCLIERMRQYNSSTSYNVMLFDTRILFLITATNSSTRQIVKTNLRGDACLAKMLERIKNQCEKEKNGTIEIESTMLVCEVLKALFNLYMHSDDLVDDQDKEEEEKNKYLISTLYKLLLFKCEKEDDLQSNIANLLTVVPYSCYSTFIPPTKEKGQHMFQGVNMSAVSVLLKFLDQRLKCKGDLIGNLSPIVTTLIRMAKTEKLIRKYTRLQILPPLKDVMHRPEEGTTLRAKLCKLLTSPLTELRDLVAEFLFILCKENVNRMVKYTGYGNAAGMFANKGLLFSKMIQADYSSESEDSETEEYLKHREQINPVTGCFELPKPNPLEGMSEEQKEYEAMQLVGLVDKLTREGLVAPCRIGADGKPKPIEHVLELHEQLSKQQYRRDSDDSD